jgi:hypothetical protein
MSGNNLTKLEDPEDIICLVLVAALGLFLLTGLWYVVIKPLVG